jgi:Transposase DDE domain
MSNFRQFDRATGFLLPPSLDEWLPERHLARFVVEVIDGLDLSAMVKSYRGSGSAGYHPALLLGLLVYGYTTGVFGIIKSVMGFRQFLLRGLDCVRGEWSLVTMAWNFKRMFTLSAGPRLSTGPNCA